MFADGFADVVLSTVELNATSEVDNVTSEVDGRAAETMWSLTSKTRVGLSKRQVAAVPKGEFSLV